MFPLFGKSVCVINLIDDLGHYIMLVNIFRWERERERTNFTLEHSLFHPIFIISLHLCNNSFLKQKWITSFNQWDISPRFTSFLTKHRLLLDILQWLLKHYFLNKWPVTIWKRVQHPQPSENYNVLGVPSHRTENNSYQEKDIKCWWECRGTLTHHLEDVS